MARSGGGRTRPRTLRVEARCAWCGVVPLDADGLHVHVRREHGGLLEFRCPTCDRLNLRRLSPGEVAVLSGVGIDPVERPAPFELMELRSGPPLTWDDLLEFHLALSLAQDVVSLSVRDGDRSESSPRVPTPMANERHAA
jgi:hypothetical protein